MSPPSDTLDSLAHRLGFRFKNPDLLRRALTHRSAGRDNYERLEFLGDAVLGLVVAEALYERYGGDEGNLSRLRASLVNRETLAEVAATLGLGDALVLGPGELKSGGFRRATILADAFEALIGAIYLDSGYDIARTFVRRVFEERLATLPDVSMLKDPKTRLQELLQGQGLPLPDYEVTETTGQPHARRFTVICRVASRHLASRGEGTSRREAEQEAALAMLDLLGKHDE